ncbi:amino acid ABC transporter permease [Kushneria sp. TE3]|uniref:amino acid ABC transporter permease n=1 Tax=Kushneria sp. TE3 TaxID=3449832 RepID=UPI003F6859AF
MGSFTELFFNLQTLAEYWPIMLRGLGWTLLLAAVIVPMGLAAGMLIATLNFLRRRWLTPFLIAYVDFFRAFPPLVLLIFIYNGAPFLGVTLSPFTAVVVALTLNSAGYYGEILRAGLASIARGQMEAARSTGLSRLQALRHVIAPQALRNVLPELVSNTLELVKATSLASVVTLPELLRSARIVQGMAYNPTPLIAAALIYFIMLWPLVRLLSRLERRVASR